MNINALTALLRTNDLGIDARKPLTSAQISQASRWQHRTEPLALATARGEAVRLARRILELEDALTVNHSRLSELITASPTAPRRCWRRPASAHTPPRSSSPRGPTPAESATTPRSPPSPA